MALQEIEDTVEDKDDHFFDYFNDKQCEYIKQVLNDEIIEEHRLKPLGQHSEPLARVLAYCRRIPMNQQLAIKHDRKSDTYMIIRLSGKRGIAPTVVDTETFQTLNEAYHGLFLKQINTILEA